MPRFCPGIFVCPGFAPVLADLPRSLVLPWYCPGFAPVFSFPLGLPRFCPALPRFCLPFCPGFGLAQCGYLCLCPLENYFQDWHKTLIIVSCIGSGTQYFTGQSAALYCFCSTAPVWLFCSRFAPVLPPFLPGFGLAPVLPPFLPRFWACPGFAFLLPLCPGFAPLFAPGLGLPGTDI